MFAVRQSVFKSPVLYGTSTYIQKTYKLCIFTSMHLKISMKSEFWWLVFYSLLQKDLVCEFSAVHEKICGNLAYGFFLLHTCKVSHVCRGIKTSPIEGTYLLDTSENSHFRPNLSEDLQQCVSRKKPDSFRKTDLRITVRN